MRATHRQTVRIKGRAHSVMIERRAIAGKQGQGGLGAVRCYADSPAVSAPVSDRPIAREVAWALADGPIRFPGEWFRN